MKLAEINPVTGVPFKDGKVRNVGNWSYMDSVTHFGYKVRVVFHYTTTMGKFVTDGHSGTWAFQPISTGWGSVSDQGGMNKILKGTGWYYSRKGGADYIVTDASLVGSDIVIGD